MPTSLARGNPCQRSLEERAVEKRRHEHPIGELTGELEDLRAPAGHVDRNWRRVEPEAGVAKRNGVALERERLLRRPEPAEEQDHVAQRRRRMLPRHPHGSEAAGTGAEAEDRSTGREIRNRGDGGAGEGRMPDERIGDTGRRAGGAAFRRDAPSDTKTSRLNRSSATHSASTASPASRSRTRGRTDKAPRGRRQPRRPRAASRKWPSEGGTRARRPTGVDVRNHAADVAKIGG